MVIMSIVSKNFKSLYVLGLKVRVCKENKRSKCEIWLPGNSVGFSVRFAQYEFKTFFLT
jgi:hypothetical protein